MGLKFCRLKPDIPGNKNIIAFPAEEYEKLFDSINPGIMRGRGFGILFLYPLYSVFCSKYRLFDSLLDTESIKVTQINIDVDSI